VQRRVLCAVEFLISNDPTTRKHVAKLHAKSLLLLYCKLYGNRASERINIKWRLELWQTRWSIFWLTV